MLLLSGVLLAAVESGRKGERVQSADVRVVCLVCIMYDRDLFFFLWFFSITLLAAGSDSSSEIFRFRMKALRFLSGVPQTDQARRRRVSDLTGLV